MYSSNAAQGSLPGGFFEVHALYDRKLLLVYALNEEGRKLQRSLVYTSDCRFSVRDLKPDTEEKEDPFKPDSRCVRLLIQVTESARSQIRCW